MAKLVPMQEAAQMLGLTVEKLNDLRTNNKIFGYRDGSSWKFKEEEIQRVATQLAADKAANPVEGQAGGDVGPGIDDDLDRLVEVGDLDDVKNSGDVEGDDDELVPAPESGPEGQGEDNSDAVIGADDELVLEDELELDSSDQELRLAGDDSDVLDLSGEESDILQESALDADNLGDTLAESDDDRAVDSDELRLAPDDDFELSTAEPVTESADEADDFSLSDAELDLDTDSEVDLTVDSDSSLEVSADNGISLEEPPTELDSSAGELQLSEDDMLTGDTGDTAHATTDNDFLLTPVDEESATDESDSGSQVIELDEDFEASQEPMITEADEEDSGLEESAGAVAVRTSLAPTSEYSVWNVLGLLLIILVLLPTGLMMVDLMRNMWSWSGTNAINSTLMDTILSMFGV